MYNTGMNIESDLLEGGDNMATTRKRSHAAAPKLAAVETPVEAVKAETPSVVTPKMLATKLNISPKVLRGWLRKNHTRAAEAKVTSATAHFTKKDDDAAASEA